MTGAIEEGISILKNSTRKKVMLLVTDGEPNNKTTARQSANRARKMGMDIITIAAGPKANKVYLTQLASEKDYAFSIQDMDQLSEIFRTAVDQYLAVK